jgi:hypothetical protein
MMQCIGDLAVPALRAMADESIGDVRRLEAVLEGLPQVEIPTHHVLHAGMYARSVVLPAGAWVTGAHIQVATVLIVSGDVTVANDGEGVRITGYVVLPADANRKQAFFAHAQTHLTMLFPTAARSVEEAELEFTDEADRLMSRRGAPNEITITGDEQ